MIDEKILRVISKVEGVDPEVLRRGVESGKIIVFGNIKRKRGC
jgi:thiamine biosynthesis protein ThiC